MLKFKFVFLLLSLTSILYAQEISGRVVDENQGPLAFAVIILETLDSQFVAGTTTNDGGLFLLENIESGKYHMHIKMLSYIDKYESIEYLGNKLSLGDIRLDTDSQMLDEVDIVAKKPVYESEADRTIVNVKNAISSAGTNALEILERSPGIQVDRINNQISMLGKNGIIILINGKRSRLDNDALIQMLNATSSNTIEKIELIHNPPSKYDADGNGGVINIIMNEEEIDGFNGQVNLFSGNGQRPKFGGSINMNFKKGETNVYVNLNTNNDYSIQDLSLSQRIQYEDAFVNSNQENSRPPYTGNHAGKLGIDFNLAPKLSLNSFIAGSFRDWKMDASAETIYSSNLGNISSELLESNERNQTTHYMISNQLNYKIKEGFEIILNYDYLSYLISNPTIYLNQKFDSDQSILEARSFESKKETPFNFHVLQLDLQQKLSDKIHLEYGLKATLSEVQNDTKLSYLIPSEFTDDFFTDFISLNEKIYAGYILSKGDLTTSLSYNLGLRYELSELDLSSAFDGNLIQRTQRNLFPSFSLNQKWGEKFSAGLSYNKRINRPGFQTLAPAFYFFDSNSVLSGNINALPGITNSFGLNLGLGSIKLNLTYSNEKQALSHGQPELNQERSLLILRPLNIDHRRIYNANVNFPIAITKFWESRYNATAMWRIENGTLQGNQINDVSGSFFMASTNHTFKLGNKWEAEISANWNSKIKLGLAEFQDRYAINLGLQKTFKNNSKLAFSITDIFDSGSEFGLISNQPNLGIYYNWLYQLEGKVFRLNYSFSFGNQKIKDKSKRSAGSQEIQNRASN